MLRSIRHRVALGLVFASALMSSTSLAASRSAFEIGPWLSSFKQELNGHSASVTGRMGLGLGASLGWTFGPFFVDYTLTWLTPQHFLRAGENNQQRDDVVYWSLFGLRAGFAPPSLPLEVYAGGEWGTYGFSAGTQNDFSGMVLKLGSTLKFPGSGEGPGLRGVQFEWRRVYPQSDSAGRIPTGSSFDLNVYTLSLVVGVN